MELRITEVEQPRKKVVGTQVSIEVYELLAEEARNGFMSVSDVLRKLIITHFRDAGRKEDEQHSC
jgi:hypothetical protein